ncbi:MAG TPA: cystathionine gamma-synthase [Acidimicrobiales bacterium]|nr:cystathionine gamma-synthase [Acidimicrobiales bacterium]
MSAAGGGEGQGTPPPEGFETRAVHAGQEPDPTTGAVVGAVHLATTFKQEAVGVHRGYEYARSGNPTRAALERQVASLEGAAFGAAFASGLAAEDAVLRALVSPGDHVVLPRDAYGGTYRLVERVHGPIGVEYAAVDSADTAVLERSWQARTRLVWIETPSNPLLSISDIAAVSALAHERGAKVVVDNTFATPYLQNPLALGADVVVHSTTKYLGGHSDVVGGFAATNDAEAAERIAFLQNAAGAVPSPFDCYLVSRGVKTLALRMDRHCANAGRIAEFLDEHPKVSTVFYPGLPSHPGHDTARRQMRGFGGMVSFLSAAGEAGALDVMARTRLFTLAESLGAVESLVEHPARMTHASVEDSPLGVAVDPSLVRLSVGIEAVDDLLVDLDHALRS